MRDQTDLFTLKKLPTHSNKITPHVANTSDKNAVKIVLVFSFHTHSVVLQDIAENLTAYNVTLASQQKHTLNDITSF